MNSTKRVLLVGWDAADWKVIHPLVDAGLMPNLRRIVEEGVTAHLATLHPIFSPMLWTSIATGKRPFRHGILGFTEPTPDRSGVQPVTNLSRKTKAIWNILNQTGRSPSVVGWWPSHPVEPIRGVMVSNHFQVIRGPDPDDWPLMPESVHPGRLRDELAELRVHPLDLGPEQILPFVPDGAEIDQDKDRRLASIMKIVCENSSIHAAATHVMETEPWDFLAVYLDGIDHFCHGFMKYHPPRQERVSEEDYRLYRNVVSAGYVFHDMMLGRLVELAGEETTVVLVSDHGFHPDHLRPKEMPAEPAGPAAEHRDLGILAMRGPGLKRDALVHGATLLDVTPTLLALYGLPVGEDMDGRVLVEAFEEEPAVETIPSWDEVAGEDGRHPTDRQLKASESREVMDQLVALGYVDPPPENREKAVADTQRELDYNLARSYMDAGMHGEAAPILADLYSRYPLEFRFGVKLAVCLRALDMTDSLREILEDLRGRWQVAADAARERMKEIRAIVRQRRAARRIEGEEAKANADPDGEVVESDPILSEAERAAVRKLRAIARGNEHSLDLLLASAAVAGKDWEAALGHLDRAAESNSHVPGFHVQVGDTWLGLKRPKEAMESYEKALALDPQNARAWVGISRSHAMRRRRKDALEAARRAVGIQFHFPLGHHFLGRALAGAKRYEEAAAAHERALSQNPNFPEAHIALARLYANRLDDAARAEEHRRTAAVLRREVRRQRRARKLPTLPPLAGSAIDEALPRWPEPAAPPEHLVRPLAAPPAEGDADAADADAPFVTIVSGLPRSGTSMMMQMLAAGGLPALVDEERPADESNPRGYYELERVKRLARENDWLGEARGKAVKVVAPLVPWLPQAERYRVVIMERDLDEIVESQRTMLGRLDREGAKLEDEKLREHYARQEQQVRALLAARCVPTLVVPHREALAEPEAVADRVADFLGLDLDRPAMAAAVDPSLHRVRGARGSSGNHRYIRG